MNFEPKHSPPAQSVRPAGCLARFLAAGVIATSLGVGLLGWLVLSILAANLRENPETLAQVSSLARQIIDHRMVVAALALPPFLIGCFAFPQRSKSPALLTLLAFAALWLLAQFAAILYAFLASLAPLYEYQPL